MKVEAPFSNLQMELLKLYSMNISEEELNDIRFMLGKYFFSKARRRVDKIWEERGYTDEIVNELVNEALSKK